MPNRYQHFILLGLLGGCIDFEGGKEVEPWTYLNGEPLSDCNFAQLEVDVTTDPISLAWIGFASDMSIEAGREYTPNSDAEPLWSLQCELAHEEVIDPNSEDAQSLIPQACLSGPLEYGTVPTEAVEVFPSQELVSGESYTLVVAHWCNNGDSWPWEYWTYPFVAP